MIRVTLFGAAGRMGSMVLKALESEPDIDVVHAVEARASEIGEVEGIPLTADDTGESFESDVWVDVSLPGSAYRHALRAEELGRPILIGTTGFSLEQAKRLDALSCAHIVAPNLSVGINVLLQELPRMRKMLGSGYDVAMVDIHHKHKKDAPSGTAKKLAQQLESEGMAPVEIVSLRAGEVVGEHRVLFATDGEQIEVIHRAESRMAFAQGVAPAVRFLTGKRSGGFSMQDVLGG